MQGVSVAGVLLSVGCTLCAVGGLLGAAAIVRSGNRVHGVGIRSREGCYFVGFGLAAIAIFVVTLVSVPDASILHVALALLFSGAALAVASSPSGCFIGTKSVVLVLFVAAGALGAAAVAGARQLPSTEELAGQTNQPLRGAELPDVDVGSSVLGWGPSDRELVMATEYTKQPSINARKSVPFDWTQSDPKDRQRRFDEPKFMAVTTRSPGELEQRRNYEDRARVVELGDQSFITVIALIANSGRDPEGCPRFTDRDILGGLRMRITTWRSADERKHVFRGWLTADGARPRWITDAVVVKAPAGTQFRLDVAPGTASVLKREDPSERIPVRTDDVLRPGGMKVGDGWLATCGESRWLVELRFRAIRA